MPTNGISGFGTTLSGASTGAVAQITNVRIGDMEVNDIDISTMLSPSGWREFVAGMKNAGELGLDLLYEDDQHDTLQGALGAAAEVWTITLPDGATFACSGYIKMLGMEVPMDDRISQPCTLKLSGLPTFTAASG